jgi:hypothetical protein
MNQSSVSASPPEERAGMLRGLINLAEREGLRSSALAEALRAYARSEAVCAAVAQLKYPAHAAASISSLYLGYRAHLLEQADGWQLSLARLSREAETVSRPSSRSLVLCVETDAPICFERYFDPANDDPFDVPDPRDLVREGHYFVAAGDVVVTEPASRWSVPAGDFDCVLLKLDGPATIPMTQAFDRATLAPTGMGFSDQKHTARDFFASLVLHLLQPSEGILDSMSLSEREQLTFFVARQAERGDTHMVTRWKYLQSLGHLQPAKAFAILEEIARDSRSIVGDRARALLASAPR